MRLLTALLIYAGLGVAGTFVLAGMNNLSVPSVTITLLIFLVGILSLDLARTHTAPWRAVRLAESLIATIALMLFFTLPIPPTPKTIGSTIILVLAIVIAVCTCFLLPRSKSPGVVVMVPGLWGLYSVVYYLLSLSPEAETVSKGPAVIISTALVLMLDALWIGAALLARPWRRAVPEQPLVT
jgi:hypothetical protein